jgi:ABC-2 type transport system permease protein
MNIYLHELKANWKSVLIWSLSITALMYVFMSIYSGFATDQVLISQMMSKFPRELLIAFGMLDMNWSTVLGFFGLIFLFSQICLAIQAANYGFSLVSIEESELTADFLLAKPVGRMKIITCKLLAAITALTITNLVVWGSSFSSLALLSSGNDYPVKPLVMLLLSIVVFQLFFLSVGMVISLLVKRVRNVTPFSMALVFGLYILNAFGGMIGEKSLEILSPFEQFDPNYIVNHAAYDPLALISVAIILISVVSSYVLYQRRNIASAV